MVIDELVTLIRFDMPGNSAGTLKKAEGAVSSLTKRVRDLGIVSMATGALTAALGINAANEANDLQRAAEVTGLTTERLQQLESVYKSVGGSAKNAAQDAEAFFRISGGKVMDDDALDVLKSFTSGLTDAEASMKLAGAGFSDDIRRVVGLGEEEFQRRMQYASDFHSLSKQEIDDLNAARAAWVDFGTTADTVSKRIQRSISPAVTAALSELTGFLNENADAIADGVGLITDSVVKLAGRGADAAGEVYGVVKPLWDIFDDAVEKYVGWDTALSVTVSALAGFAGLTAISSIAGAVTVLAGSLTGLAVAGASAAPVFAALTAAAIATDSITKSMVADSEKRFQEAVGMSNEEAFIKARAEGFIEDANRDSWHGGWLANAMSPEEADSRARALIGDSPENNVVNGIDYGFGGADIWKQMAIESRQGVMNSQQIQNSPNVTVQNEININGVRGAEQVAPAVGNAAAQSIQSVMQNSYKMMVPDGSIGHG